MDLKFCKHCNMGHPFTKEFWRITNPLVGTCKQKIRLYAKQYNSSTVVQRKLVHKKWRAGNTEYCRQRSKTYYSLNQQTILAQKNVRDQVRREKDPEFKLACTLRIRIANAIRRNSQAKVGSAVRDLGCSIVEFKTHIESQFRDGMTWDNHGKHWHLDHILPLANYQLSDRGTFRRLAHYTNYQPLLVSENLIKSNKED